MREREVIRERPVVTDREVVLEEPAPRRGGGGSVVVALVGIILVLLVGWFLLNALGILNDAAEDTDVSVPAEVEVDADVDQYLQSERSTAPVPIAGPALSSHPPLSAE